jgi:hypothetical protein
MFLNKLRKDRRTTQRGVSKRHIITTMLSQSEAAPQARPLARLLCHTSPLPQPQTRTQVRSFQSTPYELPSPPLASVRWEALCSGASPALKSAMDEAGRQRLSSVRLAAARLATLWNTPCTKQPATTCKCEWVMAAIGNFTYQAEPGLQVGQRVHVSGDSLSAS